MKKKNEVRVLKDGKGEWEIMLRGKTLVEMERRAKDSGSPFDDYILGIVQRDIEKGMCRTMTMTRKFDPTDLGLLGSAAGRLGITIPQALDKFMETGHFTDSLCDWLNEGCKLGDALARQPGKCK